MERSPGGSWEMLSQKKVVFALGVEKENFT
jgi:hypothetical protein